MNNLLLALISFCLSLCLELFVTDQHKDIKKLRSNKRHLLSNFLKPFRVKNISKHYQGSLEKNIQQYEIALKNNYRADPFNSCYYSESARFYDRILFSILQHYYNELFDIFHNEKFYINIRRTNKDRTAAQVYCNFTKEYFYTSRDLNFSMIERKNELLRNNATQFFFYTINNNYDLEMINSFRCGKVIIMDTKEIKNSNKYGFEDRDLINNYGSFITIPIRKNKNDQILGYCSIYCMFVQDPLLSLKKLDEVLEELSGVLYEAFYQNGFGDMELPEKKSDAGARGR